MGVIQKRHTKFLSYFFLLLYIFANSSFILFHHHQNENPFQNNVLIESQIDGISQDHQLITAKIHCPLCDHHTLSLHQPSLHDFEVIELSSHFETPSYYQSFSVFFLEDSFNKDPPSLV